MIHCPGREISAQWCLSLLLLSIYRHILLFIMRTRLKLNPGQRGTKKLVSQYGDRLVCVRYRYDAQQKKRFKTVELIVDEIDWEPKARRLAGDTLVRIRVALPEVEVRRQVKDAGGK
jgi:hypothetical protein